MATHHRPLQPVPSWRVAKVERVVSGDLQGPLKATCALSRPPDRGGDLQPRGRGPRGGEPEPGRPANRAPAGVAVVVMTERSRQHRRVTRGRLTSRECGHGRHPGTSFVVTGPPTSWMSSMLVLRLPNVEGVPDPRCGVEVAVISHPRHVSQAREPDAPGQDIGLGDRPVGSGRF